MQRRKKVGGILDRRFGENDPTMTPEEKALERFVKEKQRGIKKDSMFDLEDEEENANLTHLGQSLSFNTPSRLDDFNEADAEVLTEDGSDEFLQERPAKRQRLSDTDFSEGNVSRDQDNTAPHQNKTRKEVMEEVIAKSKLHKYERQQKREDDDDLRAELDKGLPDLFALMRGPPRPLPVQQKTEHLNGSMNPDRMALLNGKDRLQADKEYDERLRQMAQDQRAKPTVRTLTDEEKLHQDAERLKDLEDSRARRMRGEQEEEDSNTEGELQNSKGDEDTETVAQNDFGLGPGLLGHNDKWSLGVEDEDEFVIEDNLSATISDVELSDAGTEEPTEQSGDDEDAEFVQGLMSKEDFGREDLTWRNDHNRASKADGLASSLAYIYRCPETFEDFLSIVRDTTIEDVPTVVRRIRALYHPKLATENRAKLETLSAILVDYISYVANHTKRPPFVVLEALIRHIHSLAKTYSEAIARAFRSHLERIHTQRPTALTPGDLVILTAIGSIFPASDQFHQVVTPASLCMARYLCQKIPTSLSDLVIGTYAVTLSLQYQQLSRRYVPEVVNYILNTMCGLAPIKSKTSTATFPQHTLPEAVRLQPTSEAPCDSRPLAFWDVLSSPNSSDADNQELKVALFSTHLDLIDSITATWAEHSAFCEIFDAVHSVLRSLSGNSCLPKLDLTIRKKLQTTSTKVSSQLQKSLAARKPLQLHNHRPLAIKTSVPKFEESYNPDKHYDPDRDRSEMSKLKAEHKRERKGALRELRKDANFIARESLKEKRERDTAYEKKYKRLVAEIQGEEGREAKNYEREKRTRKGKGKR